MSDRDPGQKALAVLDDVLAKRPKKDDHGLSRATMCLTEFREHLIRRRAGSGATDSDRERLSRLNAVLSVVLGTHFPLGNAPWGELEKARTWLSDLVAETQSADTEA